MPAVARYLPHQGPKVLPSLHIQWNSKRRRKLVGIERATDKVAPANLECGNLAFSIIHFENESFGVRIFFDIHLPKFDAMFP